MSVKKEPYVKFPNDFFYDDGKILSKIGGKDSFLAYALLTSRQTMLGKVHITLKDIMDVLQLDKNSSRSKKRIVQSIKLLYEYNYISYSSNMESVRVTDTLVFEIVDKFPNKGTGWTPFYANDFELFVKIGAIPYIVMWMLRMYTNYKTGNSFLSIRAMSNVLGCSNSIIQNTTKLFNESGLFDISPGDYYYHVELNQRLRYNNTYKYNANPENILAMKDEDIMRILKRNDNKYKMEE